MTHLHTINPNINIEPQELYLDELFQTKKARKLTLQSKKKLYRADIQQSDKSRDK